MPAITRFSPKAVFANLALVDMNPQVGGPRFAGVFEDGEAFEVEDDHLGRDFLAVQADEHGAGVYAQVAGDAFRYEIDFRECVVSIEGADDMPLNDFLARAARVDDTDRFICLFKDTLYHQIIAVKERGRTAEGHRMDLPPLAEWVKAREAESGQASRFTGLYDIVAAGLDDRHNPYATMRDVHGMAQPSMRGMHEVFREAWSEVRQYPQFSDERVRALFRQQLGDRIGEFPLGSVMRLEALSMGADKTREMNALAQHLERHGAVKVREDKPFDLSNYIPGYRTSNVPVYDLDGLEVILFSDKFGVYAYAYPPSLDYRENFDQTAAMAPQQDAPPADEDGFDPYAVRAPRI